MLATKYKYEGVLPGIEIHRLEDEAEDVERSIQEIKEEILALMVASAPASGSVEENGEKTPWHQYVIRKMDVLWNELDELMQKNFKLQQAIEVSVVKPENVSEEW